MYRLRPNAILVVVTLCLVTIASLAASAAVSGRSMTGTTGALPAAIKAPRMGAESAWSGWRRDWRTLAWDAPKPKPRPVVRRPARAPLRAHRSPVRPVRPAPRPVLAPAGSVAARIAAAWPGNDYEAVSVARCESGLNPYAVGGGGRYLGLFQADANFRAAYGYGPSVEAQTMMAWRGYQARGWQPWPNCGAARFGYR